MYIHANLVPINPLVHEISFTQESADRICTPSSCADREGGIEGLEKSQSKGFLSNTGPDPLEFTKLPSQHSMLGHHRHTSETPFQWCFAGGPMMVRLLWYLDPASPHQLKKQNKKKAVKVGPPPFCIRASPSFLYPRMLPFGGGT